MNGEVMPTAASIYKPRAVFEKMAQTVALPDFEGSYTAYASKYNTTCYSVVCRALIQQTFMPNDQIITLGGEKSADVIHVIIVRHEDILIDSLGKGNFFNPVSGFYSISESPENSQRFMVAKGRMSVESFEKLCDQQRQAIEIADNLNIIPF